MSQASRPRTVFLVNPASANGSTGKRWPQLAHIAAGEGLVGDVRFSQSPGHLTELARRAVDDGAELLVVVGGDGAFHEVVNGIVGRDVEVALMMRGTGMDSARTYGIPTKPEDAARVAATGVAREIDLGKVTFRSWAGIEASEHFANIGSAGMSAAVARRADSKSKAMGGKASFFVALVEVFFKWRNAEMRVRVDGEERKGLFNNTVVANGQYHGGGMWLAPEARPDDGLFDVLVFGDLTKTDFVRNVGKIYKGTHLSHPKIEQLRGAIVEIDAAEPLPIELDGEQPGTTPARFEIVPRALRVRVPA
jgi:YegS/Rv2252/BmrU family lipid kinase